jgi:phage terminase large subunit GpA-like protein
VRNHHAGFTCSKLFNSSYTIIELVEMWLEASKSEDTKQTFVNQQLGLPYKAQVSRAIAASVLSERAEHFEVTINSRKVIVPAGVCVITVGADVQPGSQAREGRIELEAVGWGLGEESWSLGFEVFTGDPSQPEVWAQVDDYLQQPWFREDGHQMAIRACCIDSGGLNTEDVYKFARSRISRNVWAIKGASDRGGQWSPVWPQVIKAKRQKYRTGERPIIIGVNAAKEAIRQRLLIAEPGAGYCHFPNGRPEAYFAQLTAENLVVIGRGGARVRKWVLPKDRANEALDCRVYAYAALCGLYVVRRLDLRKTAAIIAGAPAPVGIPPAEVIAASQERQRRERMQPAAARMPAPQPRAVPTPRPPRQVRRGIWRTR